MGREVRRVPADWVHPKDDSGEYIPLFNDFLADSTEWDTKCAEWNSGIFPEWTTEEERKGTYKDHNGDRPVQSEYMPDWPQEQRTHYMMYETVTEGTPISPAFETPEELARWLTYTGASAFGSMMADYEHWLRVAKGGYAPSAAFISGVGMVSGVQAW